MASPRRRAAASLAALASRLEADAPGFELGQAVRILRWLADAQGTDDATRLAATPYPVFPAAEVDRLLPGEPGEEDAGRRPPRLAVGLMGLIGPMGVLPAAYNEIVVQALRARGGSLPAFLDLLHDRSLRLFAEAGHKYRLPVAFELAEVPLADPLSRTLLALIGVAEDQPRRASPDADTLLAGVPDTALLYHAGHFATRPRSAAALEAMLCDVTGLPIAVEQFRPRWLLIASSERSGLGSAFCRLGQDAVLGERFRDASSAIRLRLGPLPFGTFRSLLPDRTRLAALGRLAAHYTGPGLLIEAQLVLLPAEVPPLQLAADADPGPRLGWTTWLGAPQHRAADDAVFDV